MNTMIKKIQFYLDMENAGIEATKNIIRLASERGDYESVDIYKRLLCERTTNKSTLDSLLKLAEQQQGQQA